MAYFNYQQPENQPAAFEKHNFIEDDSDGFDELSDEPIQELSDAEKKERNRGRLRFALDAGNLFAVIGGTLLILVLVNLIINLVLFVVNDMSRNFSLFQTKL